MILKPPGLFFLCVLMVWIGSSCRQAQFQVNPVANDYSTITKSNNPDSVYCYTPGITRLQDGRLVVTMEFGGPGVKSFKGDKLFLTHADAASQGHIFTSDDQGKTWQCRGTFPFGHARPFVAGNAVYILGRGYDLMIMRSDDRGNSWSEPDTLSRGENWHQSACNVLYARENIYLVMEKRLERGLYDTWQVCNIAPVLMRGKEKDDLTKPETWTFASELVFEDAVDYRKLNYFGVPFYKMHPRTALYPAKNRGMAAIGWLEANVVQFTDPDHLWFDKNRNTFHLWMRAHTGGTNLAAICKVVENADGSMTTSLQTAPSGKKMVYVPCPGGQMRFHILRDDKSKLYWLLSSQSTDSMTRPQRLSKDRYNLPNNERHRLQLHFSKNCIDWCFAALVAVGDTPRQGRHYASMTIDGDDLHIVSRSGDEHAKDAHDGNMITFHTVKNFRKLIY